MIVDADASLLGAGCILSQVQDGKERVIAYYSHAFNRQERNYCVMRRELLAIVLALKRFEPYLMIRRFAIRTDHSSLKWLQTLRYPEQQLFRWLTLNQTFDFEIFYQAGRLHTAADGLSRRPCEENCKQCQSCDHEGFRDDNDDPLDVLHACRLFHEREEVFVKATEIFHETPWDDDTLRRAQLYDPDIAPVWKAKKRESGRMRKSVPISSPPPSSFSNNGMSSFGRERKFFSDYGTIITTRRDSK